MVAEKFKWDIFGDFQTILSFCFQKFLAKKLQLIYFKWVTENYFFFVWRVKKQNHWFACEYAFNFKAWSLINDRWPHQQLLYTTLIFRAGLSRQEATVGGVAPPHQQQQRHHAAFGRSWSRRSIVTQNLRTNLFSVGVLAQALYQWVYFFHFLFPFLTFIACVSVLESLVVSPAIILLEFFRVSFYYVGCSLF